MSIEDDQVELAGVLAGDSHVIQLLALLRTQRLPQAYIAAGAVRDAYWAHRHGLTRCPVSADVDVVFFSPASAPELDQEIERALQRRAPSVKWEVTNQAHVHTWYEDYCGVRLLPLERAA